MIDSIGSTTAWFIRGQPDVDKRSALLRSFFSSLKSQEIATGIHSIFPDVAAQPSVLIPGAKHNTQRAYDCDQRSYLDFFLKLEANPLAPTWEQWGSYFVEQASEELASGDNRKYTSLARRAAGIAKLFWERGIVSPTRTSAHRQLMRQLAGLYKHSTKKAKPLYGVDALRLVQVFDQNDLRQLRDCCIFCIGVNRGWRSASIVGLIMELIEFSDRGVKIGLQYEKNSRSSEIEYVAIPHNADHIACIPCVLRRYVNLLHRLGKVDGPIFFPIDQWGHQSHKHLSTRSVTTLLRGGLRRAGVANPNSYSSHSLRHGVVTAAVKQGFSIKEIMFITRHRSERGLRPYIESIDPWYFDLPRSIIGFLDEPIDSERGWKHAHQ